MSQNTKKNEKKILHWLVYKDNVLFELYDNIMKGSKYPKKFLFNFENKITVHNLATCLTCCDTSVPAGTRILETFSILSIYLGVYWSVGGLQ